MPAKKKAKKNAGGTKKSKGRRQTAGVKGAKKSKKQLETPARGKSVRNLTKNSRSKGKSRSGSSAPPRSTSRKPQKTSKTAAPSRKQRKVVPKPRRRPPGLMVVAVGDAVRIPRDVRNLIGRYNPEAAQDRAGEGVEGIVSSIRQIATGKLVTKTTGDLSQYVLEIVHNQTFRLHYASDQNTAGPRGPEDVRENPVWRQVRDALRELAAKNKLTALSMSGRTDGPLRSLLDGWRIVKVKAEYVGAMGQTDRV